MNITLGVALITALSTLSAGALASYTSLRIHRRQVDLQRDNTTRQLRRDAYVGLLTCCEDLSAVLSECWGSKPDECFGKLPNMSREGIIGPLDKASRLLRAIETPLNTVYLEGPKSIMYHVNNLRIALQDTFTKLIMTASTSTGVDDSIVNIFASRFPDGDVGHHIKPYSEAKLDFINAAREALGKTALFEDVPEDNG